MSWHKPYNISGGIRCGDRLEQICTLYRELLDTDQIGVIGHYTGAFSVYGHSPEVSFITTGFETHDAYYLAAGERSAWLAFADRLKEALTRHDFPHELLVHEETVNARR